MNSIIKDENTVDIQTFIGQWRRYQPAVQPEKGSKARDLAKVYKRQMDRLDIEIDRIYEQRFVETATGEELERLGAKYGIRRKSGEDDEKLRLRIGAAQQVSQSRGTYKDIAQIALEVLDCEPEQITLIRPSESGEPGTGIIRVQGDVIDDSPFTIAEIANLLGDGAVAGHKIEVQQSDAFTFGDADNGFGTEWGQFI